jgi:hypothetical protein
MSPADIPEVVCLLSLAFAADDSRITILVAEAGASRVLRWLVPSRIPRPDSSPYPGWIAAAHIIPAPDIPMGARKGMGADLPGLAHAKILCPTKIICR